MEPDFCLEDTDLDQRRLHTLGRPQQDPHRRDPYRETVTARMRWACFQHMCVWGMFPARVGHVSSMC